MIPLKMKKLAKIKTIKREIKREKSEKTPVSMRAMHTKRTFCYLILSDCTLFDLLNTSENLKVFLVYYFILKSSDIN